MITRRSFLERLTLLSSILIARPVLGSTPHGCWVTVYDRSHSSNNLSRAAQQHFRHKFFPNRSAALDRLPHKGIPPLFVQRWVKLPDGVTKEILFEGRKDIDLRTAKDLRHLENIEVCQYTLKQVLM